MMMKKNQMLSQSKKLRNDIYRFFLVHLSKMFIIFINDKKLNNRKQQYWIEILNKNQIIIRILSRLNFNY